MSKAHGPDGITGRMLREAAPVIAGPLAQLYNHSLQSGGLPMERKCTNAVPVFKKGDKEYISNYRPISLTGLLVKTLEKLYIPIFEILMIL